MANITAANTTCLGFVASGKFCRLLKCCWCDPMPNHGRKEREISRLINPVMMSQSVCTVSREIADQVFNENRFFLGVKPLLISNSLSAYFYIQTMPEQQL
jgi:hypothetical protein